MSIFKRITCDEATTICDKSQYGNATLVEIIKLRIHFIGCKICALYTKQNTLMSRILNKNKGGASICSMDKEEKRLLKEQFEAMQKQLQDK